MSDVIISVDGLGKKYVLSHQGGERGGYKRFSERLEDWVKKPFSFGKRLLRGDGRSKIGDGGTDGNPSSISHFPSTASKEEFWALKDVSFEVKRGEVVGIIGRNGAGKSTLLKILSRITEPSEGRVTLRGRVASLLEVGTGFHPELTGRENIFLNGAILGMSKAEIKKKFDEIVAFAEVERFLDTPVKRYSSGMYVRLAFAVAAHLEPEILVVDEVLAVGDAEFQKKCLGKMKDVATGGRTVLFVSHNMAAIKQLTESCLVLNHGKAIFQGDSETAITYYSKISLAAPAEERKNASRYPSKVLAIRLFRPDGSPLNPYIPGTPIRLEVDVEKDNSPNLGLDFFCKGPLGENIAFGSFHFFHGKILPAKAGRYRCSIELDGLNLASGHYDIEAKLTIPFVRYEDSYELASGIQVVFCNPAGGSGDLKAGMNLACLAWVGQKEVKIEGC